MFQLVSLISLHVLKLATMLWKRMFTKGLQLQLNKCEALLTLVNVSALCYVETSTRCHSQRPTGLGVQKGQYGDHLGGKMTSRMGNELVRQCSLH